MQPIKKKFVEHILKGGRFADPRPFLPSDILPDLKAYIDLIAAIASEIYLRKNTTQKKLPRGFDERFKIGITRLEAGSTIPVFEREYDHESEQDEFDQARDLLNEYIANANQNEFPVKFSDKVMGLFTKFGKNLKKDECIIIKTPGKSLEPIYNKQVRSKIISVNQKPYEDICFISAAVSGYDSEKKDLYLVINDGERIVSHFPENLESELKEIAKNYKKEDISIIIVGVAKYLADNSIDKIEKLQHVIIQKNENKIYLPDPIKRLNEIYSLEDGWYEGIGLHFNNSEFDLKNWLLEILDKTDIPSPYLYPTPDNSIELEWSFGFWEINCSVDFESQHFFLHATNVNNAEIRKDSFDLKDIQGKEKLIKFLGNFLTSN